MLHPAQEHLIPVPRHGRHIIIGSKCSASMTGACCRPDKLERWATFSHKHRYACAALPVEYCRRFMNRAPTPMKEAVVSNKVIGRSRYTHRQCRFCSQQLRSSRQPPRLIVHDGAPPGVRHAATSSRSQCRRAEIAAIRQLPCAVVTFLKSARRQVTRRPTKMIAAHAKTPRRR